MAGETLLSVIHKLINAIWSNEEFLDQWNEPIIYQFTKRVMKLIVITMGYHCYQLHTKYHQISYS
jgi:hypothetical protein